MTSGRITIEPDGSHDTGVCECCGHESRRVWGYAYADGRCLAVYYVHWTLDRVRDHGANFDLIVGEWGEAAPPSSRAAISLAFRLLDTGPSFMIIDAGNRPFARSALFDHAFSREELIGSAKAKEAFDIADAIWAQDGRIAEMKGG